MITETGEYDYGPTLGRMTLGSTALGAPPVHRWTPREYIETYAKARDHRKLRRPEDEAARAAQWKDYDDRFARQPVIETLWAELAELAEIVTPRKPTPPKP